MENTSKMPYVAAGFFVLAILSALIFKWFDLGELGSITLREGDALAGTKRFMLFLILSVLGGLFAVLGMKSRGFGAAAAVVAVLSIALFVVAYSADKADGFGLDYVALGFWLTGVSYVLALITSLMVAFRKKMA